MVLALLSVMTKKNKKVLCHFAAAAAFLAFCLPQKSAASFVLHITQSGADVVGTGSGTLDTTGLSTFGPNSVSGGGLYVTNSASSYLGLGEPYPIDETLDFIPGGSPFAGSDPIFGSFDTVVVATSGSGDAVVILPGLGQLQVPNDYVSGASLSDTSTWDNTTIAGLGLIPGTYTYDWGIGVSKDSFTVIIDAPQTGTPEPGSVWLLGLGGIALGLGRLHKRA